MEPAKRPTFSSLPTPGQRDKPLAPAYLAPLGGPGHSYASMPAGPFFA